MHSPTTKNNDDSRLHGEKTDDQAIQDSRSDDNSDARNENKDPSPQEVDALLTKEMEKLTMQDREKVIQRLHGVAKEDEISQEDPGFLQQKCNELHMLLDEQLRKEVKESPSESTKSSFAKAVQQDKNFVYCKEFFTWFLRGNEYNIQATAKQMYLYFAKKEELFGEALLTRDIVQSDLDEDSLEFVASGYLQKLPCYDRAGRLVIMFFPALKPHTKDSIDVERATWYLASQLKYEPSEVQCKGTVVIIYDIGRQDVSLRDVHIAKIGDLCKCMPAKKAGIHICYDQLHLQVLVAAMLFFAGTDVRIRTCRHFGTSMECKYKLMTYGIPQYAFPFQDDGTIDMENHIQYLVWTRIQEMNREQQVLQQESLVRQKCHYERSLEQTENHTEVPFQTTPPVCQVTGDSVAHHDCEHDQLLNLLQKLDNDDDDNTLLYQENEDNSNNSNINDEINDDVDDDPSYISVPRRNDVLFGKGKMILNHPGNLKFHYLIESYAEEYETATKKSEKTDISREIMQTIQTKSNGRFLKWNSNGWWEQVSDDVARNKVSHAFRTRRAAILTRLAKESKESVCKKKNKKQAKKRGSDGNSSVVTDSKKNVRSKTVQDDDALDDNIDNDIVDLHDNEKEEGTEIISVFDRKIFPIPGENNN